MWSRVGGLALFILATIAVPLRAAEYGALAQYQQGEYAAAADAATHEGGAAGFALAARAVLAEASLHEDPCLDCLKRAEDLARRSIGADPLNVEGNLQLAVALGYEARIIGAFRARLQRFPEQAKAAIDTALKVAPEDAWTLASAGGFNIEVVRSGGRFFGNLLYDANFDDGVAYYKRAIAKDPDNAVIKLQYALSLTSYVFEQRRTEIMTVLDSVAQGPHVDAYGDVMKMRAGMLLDLLHQDKRDDYLKLAHRYLGFPPDR